MNQYIITEEELDELEAVGMCWSEEKDMQRGIRSHPYQSERYRPVCYPDCENEKHIRKDERDKVLTEKRIDYLRSLGWMVAVHNDYKQNGEFHTFWLLTYPDGKYLKGEGKTDDEALEQIVEELRQAGEP